MLGALTAVAALVATSSTPAVPPVPALASAPRSGSATASAFPTGTGDQAVAYQNDYAHDGSQPGDTLRPPFSKRWWVDLGGQLSYPLIAGGRVFVVGNSYGHGTGARLFALDAATGRLLWTHDLGSDPNGVSYGAGIAYDGGRVFATDRTDGVMRAFDAASGSLLWESAPDVIFAGNIPTPPTAVAGTVYYQLGSLMYALRESDGSRAWTTGVNSEAGGSPAVDASRVYESYPCSGAYAFDSATGSITWRVEPCLGGGVSGTPALSGGRLYVRGQPQVNTPVVYDPATGAGLGQFDALTPQAFDGTTGFFLRGRPFDAGGTLASVGVADLSNQAVNWTFTGDGALRSNVLVANGSVYVGSASGNVYAVDESTGRQLWVDNAGAPILRPNEVQGNAPATGLAIGQGLLVAPATNLLVAYAPCSSTCPPDPPPLPSPDPGPQSTFYFAEGYTGQGFTEQLSLLSPHASGTATIDYFTRAGHSSRTVGLTAGRPAMVDVNADVGPGQDVSARVTLPGPGVAERVMHFQTGQWHGSTGIVGTTGPASGWAFAEGSTLGQFNEYLTLQNPGTSPVTVDLDYFTDGGAHPRKTLTLAAQTRTTVEVFSGDPTSSGSGCTPNGPGADCGVGRGIGGVAVAAMGENGGQFVAERVMYVNGFSFGSGPIADAHDAFGTTSTPTVHYFAEGTTLSGFNEYLTLANLAGQPASADITYYTDGGQSIQRHITIPANSRYTVRVFDLTDGVGPGIAGVSAVVNTTFDVVVERPMYMVYDFGAGPVAGAHDAMGIASPSSVLGFAAASTLAGDSDFLTIANTNGFPVMVTITYYTSAAPVRRTFSVPNGTRHTVQVWGTSEGVGPGFGQVGITVTASDPVFVEKPTYSASSVTYGATDTAGCEPPFGFF